MAAEDSGNKLVWFVAGAAIGATIALLYAPQSGDETRRRIAEKAGEGKGALAGSGRDLMDRGRDLYEKGRQIAEEAADMFERGKKIARAEQ